MTFPSFTTGEVLTAADMNAVGLWLIKTQTVGTAVTSVTVSDAFSSTYDNYRITYKGEATTTAECLRLRLGAATTNYFGNLIYANYTGGVPVSVGDSNAAAWTHCSGGSDGQTTLCVDLFNPFNTTETMMFAPMYLDSGNGGTKRGILSNSTSYTAFTLLVGSGTITGGTIRVYGYRN